MNESDTIIIMYSAAVLFIILIAIVVYLFRNVCGDIMTDLAKRTHTSHLNQNSSDVECDLVYGESMKETDNGS